MRTISMVLVRTAEQVFLAPPLDLVEGPLATHVGVIHGLCNL